MDQTYLIQRLEKPRNLGQFKDNPFSFGGGYKNGGLSDDAMDLIRPIFSFDYMGSAEFEFGAVPEALNKVANSANAGDLRGFRFVLPLSQVEKNWRDKSDDIPEGTAEIYVLCPNDMVRDVQAVITTLATDERNYRLKESARLAAALRPVTEYDTDVCGWLELDNGFFFFTDKEMWEQTCKLFGVNTNV